MNRGTRRLPNVGAHLVHSRLRLWNFDSTVRSGPAWVLESWFPKTWVLDPWVVLALGSHWVLLKVLTPGFLSPGFSGPLDPEMNCREQIWQNLCGDALCQTRKCFVPPPSPRKKKQKKTRCCPQLNIGRLKRFLGQKQVFQGYTVFQGHIQLQEMQQQQATALQSG